jgi:hypothetical protein
MTNFKTQAAALLESLETQSKQTQNFAQLELLILKTTQKLGQIAAQTLLDHKMHLAGMVATSQGGTKTKARTSDKFGV